MRIKALILAAGHGTRMKSDLPKVLHEVMGKPMLHYPVQEVFKATGEKPYVIIGHKSELVSRAIRDQAEVIIQSQQLGTGHAVMIAEETLKNNIDLLVVLTGDMPLIRAETIQKIIKTQIENSGPITMLTSRSDDPRGFGRVVRNANGGVIKIVEEADANQEEKRINELNSSVYCFDASWIWDALRKIEVSPKGEYYLTDLISIAVGDGKKVNAVMLDEAGEALGINNRIHLSEAGVVMKTRINNQWMARGVTIEDPLTTYIEEDVILGKDTVIKPNTHLRGKTEIGENCVIGPNTIIDSTIIDDDCQVIMSVLEEARLEKRVRVGPFAHLRKGTHLAEGVHVGNFGEVKNSYLGPDTKMGHFSYIGDTHIEEDVNIGAGTVTCNYDGKQKHKTIIRKGAFIGSDSMLVAPVEIGEGAVTGAGSVVTKDVPPHTTAVGIPARSIRKKK